MIVVGVTGGIASGKSLLVREWVRRGARAIDLDRIGWEVLTRPAVRDALAAAFGRGILVEGDRVDRKRLAERAFADPASTSRLNAIVHPPILEEAARRIDDERRSGFAGVLVVEASLIMEAGRTGLFDYVVLVTSEVETRLARLAANGMGREEGLARMRRQWTDDEKRPLADFIVANDGSLEDLARAAEDLWATISARSPRERGSRIRNPDPPTPAGPAVSDTANRTTNGTTQRDDEKGTSQ